MQNNTSTIWLEAGRLHLLLAIQLATAEASKGYQPAQVINTLKGVGTPQGSERLIAIGGVHLTR